MIHHSILDTTIECTIICYVSPLCLCLQKNSMLHVFWLHLFIYLNSFRRLRERQFPSQVHFYKCPQHPRLGQTEDRKTGSRNTRHVRLGRQDVVLNPGSAMWRVGNSTRLNTTLTYFDIWKVSLATYFEPIFFFTNVAWSF